MIAIEREKKEENMRDKRNVERNMQKDPPDLIRESIGSSGSIDNNINKDTLYHGYTMDIPWSVV